MNRLSRGSISLGGSRRQSSQTLSYEKVEGLTTKPAMPAWQLAELERTKAAREKKLQEEAAEEAKRVAASARGRDESTLFRLRAP